jgi:hypothetical protein
MSSTPIVSLSDIPAEQLSVLKQQVQSELEPILMEELKQKNTVDIAKFKDSLRKDMDVAFAEEIKKLREEEQKKKKPLTHEEIQVLLTKEYVTFPVIIQDEENKQHEFTLRELPQGVELELYKGAKNITSRIVKEANQISFKVVDNDLFQNILSLMDVFEPIQDFLAEACSLCLNPPKGNPPKKKNDWLTPEWVKYNLSNYRIATIITAQVEVSKMRDFFSILFQGFQSVATVVE